MYKLFNTHTHTQRHKSSHAVPLDKTSNGVCVRHDQHPLPRPNVRHDVRVPVFHHLDTAFDAQHGGRVYYDIRSQ